MPNPVIGKSGTKLTEVRSGKMRADGSAVNMNGVQNPYMDGKRIQVGAGTGKGFRDGVSCGWGPSKLHCNEEIPELNDLEITILMTLDDHEAMNFIGLNALIPVEGEQAQVDATWTKTLEKLAKEGYTCHTKRNGGGWALMAEGRRVASLLKEVRKKGG